MRPRINRDACKNCAKDEVRCLRAEERMRILAVQA